MFAPSGAAAAVGAFTASGAFGRTTPFHYYVDSVAGSDSNNGLTTLTPYLTLSKLKTSALAFGNNAKLALKYGSSWKEDLDLSTLTGVTVAAYGSSASGLPIIDGSIVKANAGFTKTVAQTNVYEISFTQTALAANSYITAWENGTMLTYVASIALVDSTASSFYVSGTGPGTWILYIHSSDNSSVIVNAKTYEMSDPNRDGALRLGNYSSVSHVHTRRNTHNDGSLIGGIGCSAYGCLFEDGVKHNALFSSGSFERCVAYNCEKGQRTNAILMEFYAANATGLTGRYKNCIAVGPDGTVAGLAAFSGHTDGVTSYASIDHEDVAATKVGLAITANRSLITTVTRAYAYDCSATLYAGFNMNATDVYSVSVNVPTANRVLQAAAGATLNIDGFRYFTSATNTNYQIFNLNQNASTVNITRSAFVFNALSFPVHGFYENSLSTLSIKGSIVTNTNATNLLNFINYAAGGGVAGEFSNNCYYAATASKFQAVIDGVSYTTGALYLAAKQPTNEIGSVIADPVLASPSTGNFTASGSIPANCGIQRAVTYLTLPTSLAEAKAFALAA